MDTTAYFEEMLAKTRLDGRYRTFAQLERIAGAFPLNHNSMIEGIRRSSAERFIFRHNKVAPLEEASLLIETRRRRYNIARPNSSSEYRPPVPEPARPLMRSDGRTKRNRRPATAAEATMQ